MMKVFHTMLHIAVGCAEALHCLCYCYCTCVVQSALPCTSIFGVASPY